MKKIVFLLFFIISTINLPAKSINFFTLSKPIFVIKQSLFFNILESEEDTFLGLNTKFSLDMKELFISTGLQTNFKDTDFTIQATYWPSILEHFNIGPKLVYHVQVRPNVFTEHDILTCLAFKFRANDFFSFFSQIGYHKKISEIDAIKSTVNALQNDTMNIGMKFLFCFTKNSEFYLSFLSNSFFSYPVFCSPIFAVGTQLHFMEQFSFGVELSSIWIDMFTVSASPTTFALNSFIQVKL